MHRHDHAVVPIADGVKNERVNSIKNLATMHEVHHIIHIEIEILPNIHRLIHALKICMYADDHAPPHFHVKRPGVAFQVRLDDLEVMEGHFDRRDLELAVAWAATTWICWLECGESSMSEADLVTVGKSLPRISSVSFHEGYEIAVRWDNATRRGGSDIVDLAPLIFRLKFYSPLRDNRALLSTVHTIDQGTAIGWGPDDEVDMAATSVLNLADERLSAADFDAFMKRHNFTFDRVAAELGISKRLAGYYASGRPVPRYISLACQFIDQTMNDRP